MAARKTYLVPIDFSKTAQKALAHAVQLARTNQAKLLLLHVITESSTMVPFQVRDDYFDSIETEARTLIKKLINRYRLTPKNYRVVILRGNNAAQLISEQAKKSRVAMIIMGSQGLKGMPRLILGSVAEQTLRYASCPVLIVK